MRSTSTTRMPAATRSGWKTWSRSATCAAFRSIPSRRAAPPGWWCRPPIRKKAGCTTCAAARKGSGPTASPMRSGSAQRGFTYLAMLLAVAVIGIGLAAAGQVWTTAAQREKEQQLLFVGNQYRRAIGLYHRNSPNQLTPGVAYPKALKDLLEDKRRG